MNTTVAKKRGRPPNPPQTAPIIAATIRSRVTRTVNLSGPTAAELERYVTWASGALHISKQDALLLTIDRALVDLFRKDQLWQQLKRQPSDDTSEERRFSTSIGDG